MTVSETSLFPSKNKTQMPWIMKSCLVNRIPMSHPWFPNPCRLARTWYKPPQKSDPNNYLKQGALFIAQMLTRTFDKNIQRPRHGKQRLEYLFFSSFQKVAFRFQGSAYLSHAEWSFPCDQRRTQFLLGLNEELTLLLEVQDTVERGLAHQMSYSISTQHHLNGSRNSTCFTSFLSLFWQCSAPDITRRWYFYSTWRIVRWPKKVTKIEHGAQHLNLRMSAISNAFLKRQGSQSLREARSQVEPAATTTTTTTTRTTTTTTTTTTTKRRTTTWWTWTWTWTWTISSGKLESFLPPLPTETYMLYLLVNLQKHPCFWWRNSLFWPTFPTASRLASPRSPRWHLPSGRGSNGSLLLPMGFFLVHGNKHHELWKNFQRTSGEKHTLKKHNETIVKGQRWSFDRCVF